MKLTKRGEKVLMLGAIVWIAAWTLTVLVFLRLVTTAVAVR